jgi:hypothetical protein
MPERLPFQQFHRDEGSPLDLVDFVDRADLRVIERGSGLRFALKTGERLRIAGNILWHELESNEAVQADILSLVHHAHPTTTQLLDDAVMGDDLADDLGG